MALQLLNNFGYTQNSAPKTRLFLIKITQFPWLTHAQMFIKTYLITLVSSEEGDF